MHHALLAAVVLAAPLAAFAQHVWSCPMHPEVRSDGPGKCPKCGMSLVEQEEEETLTVPHARDGSGTAWQPDATPMYGEHAEAGDWMLMLHGGASFGWDTQGSKRGDRRAVSTNWLMAMARRPLFSGDFTARTMLSLEPLTVYGEGFPLLLQTGETYQGVHLHDRQHPHDLFMELSLGYRRPLSDWLGVEVYAAPVGEPALGPVAFMHRASARVDPFPPLGHHWQDSTHVSFGVVTAGLYTKQLKLEGSWFNGREPDENRWNFDFRPFDSFSLRLAAAPVESVSVQVSYGHLASPEPPGTGVVTDVSRVTASLTVSRPGVDATLAWGRNLAVTALDSLLAEATFDIGGHDAPFVRLEYVDKTAHDLQAPGVASFTRYGVWNAVLGWVHSFPSLGPVVPGIGVRGSLGVVPEELNGLYGGRAMVGGYFYLLLQSRRLERQR
jgi:hypothetical protein